MRKNEVRECPAPFLSRVEIPTTVVLARCDMSPREIEAIEAAGSTEMRGIGKDEALLEAGGVAIAAGRIVRRGGKAYLSVRTVFGDAEKGGAS